LVMDVRDHRLEIGIEYLVAVGKIKKIFVTERLSKLLLANLINSKYLYEGVMEWNNG